MTQTKRLNKQELRRINLRWIWNAQIGWNYERMQGLGYLTTMLPLIEKLYGDQPALKKKRCRHILFSSIRRRRWGISLSE